MENYSHSVACNEGPKTLALLIRPCLYLLLLLLQVMSCLLETVTHLTLFPATTFQHTQQALH